MKSHIYLYAVVGAAIVGVGVLLVGGFSFLFDLTGTTIGDAVAFGPRWFGVALLLFLAAPLLVGYWTARTGYRRGSARGVWHGIFEGGAAAALAALLSGSIGALLTTLQAGNSAAYIDGATTDLVDYLNAFALFMLPVIFAAVVYWLLGLVGAMFAAGLSDLAVKPAQPPDSSGLPSPPGRGT